jgi:hypothetical protein
VTEQDAVAAVEQIVAVVVVASADATGESTMIGKVEPEVEAVGHQLGAELAVADIVGRIALAAAADVVGQTIA